MSQQEVIHPLWNENREKETRELQKWIYVKFRYEFSIFETFFLWIDISNELSEKWLEVSNENFERSFIQKSIHQFAQNKLFN